MRDEGLHLADIVAAAEAIDRFLAGIPRLRIEIARILADEYPNE